MIVDIHTHILPHLDDGSASVEESLAMLRALRDQGIGTVVATPHFYGEEQSPEEFLWSRNRAWEALHGAWEAGLPALLLGAEVCYFSGISRTAGMEALRIQGTRLMLLEMPFCTWSTRMLDEVIALNQKEGFTVLLAHVERYFRFALNRAALDRMWQGGVQMQSNAGFLLDWHTRGQARRLLRQGRIHFIGSDCHNMSRRPPRLGDALRFLKERDRERLEENAQRYFSAEK